MAHKLHSYAQVVQRGEVTRSEKTISPEEIALGHRLPDKRRPLFDGSAVVIQLESSRDPLDEDYLLAQQRPYEIKLPGLHGRNRESLIVDCHVALVVTERLGYRVLSSYFRVDRFGGDREEFNFYTLYFSEGEIKIDNWTTQGPDVLKSVEHDEWGVEGLKYLHTLTPQQFYDYYNSCTRGAIFSDSNFEQYFPPSLAEKIAEERRQRMALFWSFFRVGGKIHKI